jgi:hypothetical protein
VPTLRSDVKTLVFAATMALVSPLFAPLGIACGDQGRMNISPSLIVQGEQAVQSLVGMTGTAATAALLGSSLVAV